MNSGRGKIRRLADVTLIGCFFLAIWVPLLGTFYGLELVPPANENRPLASWPQLGLQRKLISSFPSKFEAWWSDHFGFRQTMIRGLGLVKVGCLRVSSSPNVILGQRAWLYYTLQPIGNDYSTTRPLSLEHMKQWQKALEARRDWLAQRGIPYVFVIAPDKQSIYPEYLPSTLSGRTSSRLDQFLDHMRAHSSVPVLDLREPLLQAKAKGRVYWRTDSHWNERGAYLGYREILRAVSVHLPEVQPLPPEVFEKVHQVTPGGDLAGMLGMADRLPEENFFLRPIEPRRALKADARVPTPPGAIHPDTMPFAMECDDPSLPRAVMFRDSFGIALVPFISEHFQRIVYVWQDHFDATIVEREKPAIVIQEMVERRLVSPVPPDQWPRTTDH